MKYLSVKSRRHLEVLPNPITTTTISIITARRRRRPQHHRHRQYSSQPCRILPPPPLHRAVANTQHRLQAVRTGRWPKKLVRATTAFLRQHLKWYHQPSWRIIIITILVLKEQESSLAIFLVTRPLLLCRATRDITLWRLRRRAAPWRVGCLLLIYHHLRLTLHWSG